MFELALGFAGGVATSYFWVKIKAWMAARAKAVSDALDDETL